VYPNPASETFFIRPAQVSGQCSYQADLYNNMGQAVSRRTFPAGYTVSFTVSQLPEGIYFLILTPLSCPENANCFSTKIVVTR
jgi:hypothetical protein